MAGQEAPYPDLLRRVRRSSSTAATIRSSSKAAAEQSWGPGWNARIRIAGYIGARAVRATSEMMMTGPGCRIGFRTLLHPGRLQVLQVDKPIHRRKRRLDHARLAEK